VNIELRSASGRHPAAPAAAPPALRALDLHVAAGEQAAVIGPSGAGKTTLLHLMACALAPAAGSIELDGRDPWRLPRRELQRLRGRLFLAPQVPPLPPRQRVVTAVLAGRLPRIGLWQALRSLFYPTGIAQADAALARFDMADKLFARVDRVSGGERAALRLPEERVRLAGQIQRHRRAGVLRESYQLGAARRHGELTHRDLGLEGRVERSRRLWWRDERREEIEALRPAVLSVRDGEARALGGRRDAVGLNTPDADQADHADESTTCRSRLRWHDSSWRRGGSGSLSLSDAPHTDTRRSGRIGATPSTSIRSVRSWRHCSRLGPPVSQSIRKIGRPADPRTALARRTTDTPAHRFASALDRASSPQHGSHE